MLIRRRPALQYNGSLMQILGQLDPAGALFGNGRRRRSAQDDEVNCWNKGSYRPGNIAQKSG
jgi:hypothetical protein